MFDMLVYMISDKPLVTILFVPVVIAVAVTMFELSPARNTDVE